MHFLPSQIQGLIISVTTPYHRPCWYTTVNMLETMTNANTCISRCGELICVSMLPIHVSWTCHLDMRRAGSSRSPIAAGTCHTNCQMYSVLQQRLVLDNVLKICYLHLQKCGMAATIIGMLADVNLFWEYDNRETLMQRDKDEPNK